MSGITPRQDSLVFYQGDDIERLAEAHRKAEVAERAAVAAPLRVGDGDDVQQARDEYNAVLDEVTERATIVHIQAVPRKRFRALMAAHPPTDATDADDAKVYGVDPDSFAEEFFPVSILRMEPEPEGGRQAWLDSLADGDFTRLFDAAYWLNRSLGGDASASRYSSASRSSDAT